MFKNMCIADYLGIIKEDLIFDLTISGKPFLKNNSSIKFNVSHTKGAIACAIGEIKEIGLDMEYPRKVNYLRCKRHTYDVMDLLIIIYLDRKSLYICK